MRKINDKLLVRVLIRNPRLPNTAIAKLFGVSEAAVRKKIEKLENDGTVIGYTTIVDPTKAGLAISYTGIDVRPEKMMEIYEKLQELREAEVIFLTSGDHNILVKLVCNSMNELMEVHKRIEKMNGVTRVCPAVITSVWKRGRK